MLYHLLQIIAFVIDIFIVTLIFFQVQTSLENSLKWQRVGTNLEYILLFLFISMYSTVVNLHF